MPGIYIPDFALFAQSADVDRGQAVNFSSLFDCSHIGITDSVAHVSTLLSIFQQAFQ